MTAEVLLLMLPASILLALAVSLALPTMFRYPLTEASDIAVGASVVSVVCLWRMVFRFYSGGAAGLRALSFAWWSGAVLGAFIATGALASWLAPKSPPYSYWGEFRERFDLLALGLPLLAPLVHFGFEALFRGGSFELLKRTFAALSTVVLMLIAFIVCYRWDSGTNRSHTWGYWGQFNIISNSLSRLPGIEIVKSHYDSDVTIREFAFEVLTPKGQKVFVLFGDGDPVRKLSGQPLSQALLEKIASARPVPNY